MQVCSHLGRPKTDEDRRTYAMAPVRAPAAGARPGRAARACSRTPASTRARRRTTPASRASSPTGTTSTSTTRSARRTVRTAPRRRSRTSCRPTRGCLLLAELDHLGRLLGEVERPFVLIAGGAKVEDKLAVLEHLGGRADRVLIGGKMAEQVREDNPLPYPVELPVDVVAASAFAEDAESQVANVDEIPDGWLGLDIGPATAEAFGAIVARRADDLLERPDGRLRVAAVSRPAPARSPRPSPPPTRTPSSAAATRCGRFRSSGSPIASPGSRRAAARRSSCWRARSSPAWQRSRRHEMAKLMAGNWKMFKGPVETLAFFDAFEAPDGVDVVLCPPFCLLEAAVGEEWPIYAQNVHWAQEGAFTGEISAPMLVEIGVRGALVGHSERRQYFGETDETVRQRAEAALEAGLGVIACVGETEAEREAGETEAVLRRQVAVLPRHDAARDRLRARLGDRHGQDRDPRARAGGARADQVAARHARALRRLGEAGQRRGAARSQPDGRRRARRRRLARSRVLHEPVPHRRFPLVTLVVLDGCGLAPPGPGNAVELAVDAGLRRALERPSRGRLWRRPGEAVGLPPGQMGNSEVGHLTIGSGRVLFQDLMRVNVAVRDGSLYENPTLVAAFARARERGGTSTCSGLVSRGGVHSHLEHLLALLELARRQGMAGRTWIHAFTDGRDVSPHAAATDLAALPAERIATVVGRYYAMDRDNRSERTERAVAAILDGDGPCRGGPDRRCATKLRGRDHRRVHRARFFLARCTTTTLRRAAAFARTATGHHDGGHCGGGERRSDAAKRDSHLSAPWG